MAKVDGIEDHGRFAMKQAINSVGVQSGTAFATSFAKGAIQGCIHELIALMGEREAFEFVMKQADAIVREPGTVSGGVWTPGGK